MRIIAHSAVLKRHTNRHLDRGQEGATAEQNIANLASLCRVHLPAQQLLICLQLTGCRGRNDALCCLLRSLLVQV